MAQATLTGIAKKYRGNGRKLGYPTANIPSDTKLKDGVYFGFADLGRYRQRPALIFIGTPVTVGDPVRRVEAHLLDAEDKDYYGLTLKVEVVEFWRGNRKFDSVYDLMQAMKADELAARSWFAMRRLA